MWLRRRDGPGPVGSSRWVGACGHGAAAAEVGRPTRRPRAAGSFRPRRSGRSSRARTADATGAVLGQPQIVSSTAASAISARTVTSRPPARPGRARRVVTRSNRVGLRLSTPVENRPLSARRVLRRSFGRRNTGHRS